jgi:Uncharacterized protein conserved in bacteria (DUF2188)
MAETRHVVPAKDGGWAVVREFGGNGSSKTRQFDRKRDAEAHAKDEVRQRGGGEVILHTPAGRIVESNTVTPDAPVPAA